MPPLLIENLDALKDFVGREIATTDWFEITQDRIQQFAEATEDRQWIHLDPDRAAKGIALRHDNRARIPDSVTAESSVAAGVADSGWLRMAVNYGLNRVRFPSPVHAGSKIRARFTLQSLKDVGNPAKPSFLS